MFSPSATTIRALAKELADRGGYELVNLHVSPAGRRQVIRVFIHREEGVTIEDCRVFSEDLGALIELESAVRGPYVLEVSSPGMTSHLKTLSDFRRSVGREVEVDYLTPDGMPAKAGGTILRVEDDIVHLATSVGEVTMPIQAVRQAKPVIDWGKLFRDGKKRARPEENRDE